MDDYISREKAIETIQYRVCQGHGNKEHICKRGSCAYCGIMEVMSDIESIEAADVRPVNQWISVNDRLPENCIEVLVYDTDCGIVIGWYDKKDSVFVAEFINELDAVTHWMPLPKSPKDGDTNA